MTIHIEEILGHRSVGPMQSVGHMQVIPIIGENDDSWAPPDVHASTSDYGEVRIDNDQSLRTIVPPGVGFLTKQNAQDHGIGRGALLPAGGHGKFENACCIQETQPGLIRKERGIMVVLPARLRAEILRQDSAPHNYASMWPAIRALRDSLGRGGLGNVTDFLGDFSRELDTFVAEFECVQDQVGAIVLVGGEIVGLEVVPNHAFWQQMWEPLIRICYGSLALAAHRTLGETLPATRPKLRVLGAGLDDLVAALDDYTRAENQVVHTTVRSLAQRGLRETHTSSLGSAQMYEVRDGGLIGQIVRESNHVGFASISAALH